MIWDEGLRPGGFHNVDSADVEVMVMEAKADYVNGASAIV